MAEAAPPDTAPSPSSATSRLISASAVMAAGTMLSRVLGFGRLMLLVVLLGNGTRQADMFTIANTVPNSMYILLAGGVLNTVLVPQIVRAIKADPDGGEAYTNRIMTAGLIVLGVITVALTLAVPLIIDLYSAGGWKAPGLDRQYDSMVMLAYYCMPQVFFYGVHVLAGQVLNARDKFGPMMWAPIANNVISIVVLVIFLGVFGHPNPQQPFSSGQELLLGLGSTLGIVAQAAVLVPFLRAAGYRFRPRFDFAHTGLGKTFGLAKWTLGFVVVTQLAYVVVSRLASGATVSGRGAGLLVYSNAWAVWILPHSLITVSLATAMLPSASRLAAAGDLTGVAADTTRTVRLAITALLPASVGFVALGLPIARLAFGFGRGAADAPYVGWALMALAVGLVPFTVQYICLRAFYALEDTRTPFLLQIVISAANVALGLSVVALLDRPSLVATGLAVAYSVAYLVGVVISFRQLHRRLPALDGRLLLQHGARLLVAVAPAAVAAWLICWGFSLWSTSRLVLLISLAVAGVVAVGVFALLARVLHIQEVNDIVGTVRSRTRRGVAAPTEASLVWEAGEQSADPVPPGDSTAAIPAVSPTIGAASAAPPAWIPNSGVPSANGPIRNVESMASYAGAVSPTEHGSYAEGIPDDALVAEAEPADIGRNANLPAGTVLAQRYRLEELLAEATPTVTWRAFDQVLSRSVLVHLLPPGDPGAPELLAAARQAAAATDSRFLRVLDAVHSDDPEIGSYIVCEYATGQSLEAILSHGPLSGLEAAWVVREVADALSGVHLLGLYHQRINPDTVIITPTGNVKIVGLLIEAHLRPSRSTAVHGANTPEMVDVLDLGRLLYAALVSRWPGGPAFSLPDAPVIGHRWMTPRQVRAGVSPALDHVCDQILGDPPRHHVPLIGTVNGVVNELTKVLGPADASGDLERRLRQPIPRVGGNNGPPLVSSLLDQPTQQLAAVDRPGGPGPAQPVSGASTVAGGPASITTPARRSATVGFADAGQATIIRTPAPPGSGAPTKAPAPRRQPRRWIPLVIILALLLIGAGVIAAVVVTQRATPGTAPTPGQTAPATTAPPAGPVVNRIVSARDFDPEGTDRTENTNEVKNAYDGNLRTRWRTVNYIGNPQLGGIKRGVGLVFDLGQAQPVSRVTVALSGTGTTVEARVPKADPATTTKPPMASDARWTVAARQAKAGSNAVLTFDRPVTTRFVLVYLTSLPKEGNGYRGGIYEVEVYQ